MPLVRRFAKAFLLPVRRILDPRFHDIAHRIFETRQQVGEVEAGVGVLSHRIEAIEANARDATAVQVEAATMIGQELRPVSSDLTEIRADLTEIRADLTALGAQLGLYREQISELSSGEQDKSWVHRLTALSTDGHLADLDGPVAGVLNYAASHRGFAAQAELWMNPPLVLEHVEHDVRLAHVNERVVEVPFAFRALGEVPLGSPVLDFGAAESTVALALATMGYTVTALDLREYPFEHPNLTSVSRPLEEFDAPAASFDAITAISTVEHVGLGWYGEASGRYDDLRAMSRLRELLRPGGTLVLTVPYGAPSADAMQRRYDGPGVDALLDGFDVVDRVVVEQRADTQWEPVEESTGHAVALVRARLRSA